MIRCPSSILLLRYRALSLAARFLPIPVFRAVFAPLVWVIVKKSHTDPGDVRARYEDIMNLLLLGFSKSLMHRRWSRRCEFTASRSFDKAIACREPIILLFIHEGPLPLLPHWLRAFGVKASVLIGADSSTREPHQRWREQHIRFPEQQLVWHRDELKGCINFLKKGGVLLIAIDSSLGKQATVEMKDGRTFRCASGPLRLAAKYNCTMFSCGLESLGGWRFKLRIGDGCTKVSSDLIDDLSNRNDVRGYPERIRSRLHPPVPE